MQIQTGSHTVRVEGDIVFVKRSGETDLIHARAMCEAMSEVLKKYRRGFRLFDLNAAGGFGHDARAWVGEWEKKHQVTALAGFGGSLEIRSMTKLIASAVRTYPGREAFKAAFYDTEAEARAWLEAERRGLAKVSSPAP